MASLAELAAAHTCLDGPAISHLQRLVGSWALPCDLSFADLLLYAPVEPAAGEFVVVGHVRSTTGTTAYDGDPVGSRVSASARPDLRRSLLEGVRREVALSGPPPPGALDEVVEEGVTAPLGGRSSLVDHVPVRFGDDIIAVLTRESDSRVMRTPTGLEQEYRALFDRFAIMIGEGSFPAGRPEKSGEFREPRVGDGVLVLDREQLVVFASPNAVSALHRLGVQADLTGRRLDAVGIDDAVVRRALESRRSTITEIEHGDDLSVVVRCHPLVERGRSTGVLALTRDVSELRSRDRLLVSKDATIREIHHRVKNNLQTIQSLLQLQARRLGSGEAKDAVAQSARRIGSIAIVHETLASDATDEVDFDTVVRRVVRLVEEGFTSPERPVRVSVAGQLGELNGEMAMPLAVALVELVQNAVDHAGAGAPVAVRIDLAATRHDLVLRIADDGVGVPEGFSLDRDAGLGLAIVRQFVVADLSGTITIGPASDAAPVGTLVEIRIPRRREPAVVG
ncbi:MAG: histidine kinase N-terminal domain-containing protein [Actinomycetota bacterium]